MPKNKLRKARAQEKKQISGEHLMPLVGFRGAEMPDVSPIKMMYSDYRVLTAVGNQVEYFYRANSLFDPDASGVGGQPQGFDQWKTLYGVYRVVAVRVQVQAVGNGASANGLLSVAPTDTTGAFASAEEVGGLRRAQAAAFSPTQVASIDVTYHIGQLLGRSDETILADPNCSAAVTTNPVTQFYICVAIETGNSATGQSMVWTRLTYYTRFEVPIATLDTVSSHSLRFAARLSPPDRGAKAEAGRGPSGQSGPLVAKQATITGDDRSLAAENRATSQPAQDISGASTTALRAAIMALENASTQLAQLAAGSHAMPNQCATPTAVGGGCITFPDPVP